MLHKTAGRVLAAATLVSADSPDPGKEAKHARGSPGTPTRRSPTKAAINRRRSDSGELTNGS